MTETPFDELRQLYEKKLHELLKPLIRDLTVDARTRLVDAILSQTLPEGPELSESWLAEKERRGLDLRKLIATGGYLENIIVVETEDGYEIRPTDDEVPGSDGLTYFDLANVLEYGTETIPPRPHWRIIHAEVESDARRLSNDMSEQFAAAVNRELDAARRQQERRQRRRPR